MSSKNFIVAVVSILVLGGVIGGAFVAGMTLGGRSDDEQPAGKTLTLPPPGGSAEAEDPASGAAPGDFQNLGQIITQIESGEMTEEQAAQMLQQAQIQAPGGMAPGGSAADVIMGGMMGGGLFGTVDSIEDGRMTIGTPQGPLGVTFGQETEITRTETVTLDPEDLTEGLQVQIIGEPNRKDGGMDASAILVIPEWAGPPGGFGQ